MARTLIWNTSASAQTLPAAYGGGAVQPGYGWIVADESSIAVAALGGFADMHGKWAVSAISTDEALGSVDMSAAGVALIADVVATIGGGGGGGGGGPVSWASVTGKPSFAAVATSGAYADLSGKPALADVATSGLYSDLSGTPTLPTAGNTAATTVSSTAAAGVQAAYARVDHQHAHGNLAGGSMHAAATTASAGFMSAADKLKVDGLAAVASSGAYADLSGAPALAAVATSGDYADLSGKPSLFDGAYASLTGKPSLFSGSYTDLTDKPSLFSGAYADLSGKPTLAAVATTGDYASLSGAPALATVATSGSYNDLSDKPSIPTLPTLATVATSGDYADLSGKPDLSGYLTSVATANIADSAVTTAKIAAGAVTDAKITSVTAAKVLGLAAVATSGAYGDLSGKPSLATVATSGAYADLSGKPTLAAVATSGSASDLSNQPYDIIGNGVGSLAVGKVIMTAPAPRALVLQSIQQGAGDTAQVTIKVNGVAASYPQNVAAGALITAVISTAGTDCYFSITGKVA